MARRIVQGNNLRRAQRCAPLVSQSTSPSAVPHRIYICLAINPAIFPVSQPTTVPDYICIRLSDKSTNTAGPHRRYASDTRVWHDLSTSGHWSRLRPRPHVFPAPEDSTDTSFDTYNNGCAPPCVSPVLFGVSTSACLPDNNCTGLISIQTNPFNPCRRRRHGIRISQTLIRHLRRSQNA
jgi:hypothetical protein